MENIETKICELHGPYEPKKVSIRDLVFYSGCPICESIENEREQKEQEEKEKERLYKNYMARGIEPEFFNATLENYQPENESEKKALEAAREIKEGKIKKLLLLGTNGCGKTHLANALAKDLDGLVLTMFEFNSLLRGGYNKKKTEIETIEENLLIYDFVVLDEYGLSKCSEMEQNALAYFVDKMHVRGKSLMICSNMERAATNRSNAIENYMPNAVISRFLQNSKIVEVKGRDRRRAAPAPL
jgi:DNA replication protein DnaC